MTFYDLEEIPRENSENHAKRIFEDLDTDGNGTLDEEEFVKEFNKVLLFNSLIKVSERVKNKFIYLSKILFDCNTNAILCFI